MFDNDKTPPVSLYGLPDGEPVFPENNVNPLEQQPKAAYEKESATFMDDQNVIAPKRTDYAPDQVGCGSKFHPELSADEARGTAPCGPEAETRRKARDCSPENPCTATDDIYSGRAMGEQNFDDPARLSIPENFEDEIEEEYFVGEPWTQ